MGDHDRIDAERISNDILRHTNDVMIAGREKHETIALAEYFDRLEQAPHIAESALARTWRMLESRGGVDALRRQFLGVDDAIFRIAATLRGMAQGGQLARHGLCLYGPPSSGKTVLANMLFDGLVEFTKPGNGNGGIGPGAVYGIVGCPLHDDPALLLPHKTREQFNVNITGDICPHCRQRLMDALEEQGDAFCLADVFEVERLFFTRRAPSVGRGYLFPLDPKHQGIEAIMGDINITKLSAYPTSHPFAWDYSGAPMRSNRGVFHFEEGMRADERQLRPLLTILEEGILNIDRIGSLWLDELLIITTNVPNLRDRLTDEHAAAIIDRLMLVRMPYTVERPADEAIVHSLIADSRDLQDEIIHLDPLALHVCATVDTLSRIPEDESAGEGLSRQDRMLLYEQAANPKAADAVREDARRKRRHNEGMEGISYRYASIHLQQLISKLVLRGQPCCTARDALTALHKSIAEAPEGRFSPEERERYRHFCMTARSAWYDRARDYVLQALYGDELRREMNTVLEEYCDIAAAWLNDADAVPETQQALMIELERRAGIADDEAKDRRREFLEQAERSRGRHNGVVDIGDFATLHSAVQEYLFDSRRHNLSKALAPSAPQRLRDEVLAPFLERMLSIERTTPYGGPYRFCEYCALETARAVLDSKRQ